MYDTKQNSYRSILDTFTFQGHEYPIYSLVRLNDLGRRELKTDLECVQIIQHTVVQQEKWHDYTYRVEWTLIGNQKNTLIPYKNVTTAYSPDEIIKEVVEVAPLTGVKEGLCNKQLIGYNHSDIIFSWMICIIICFTALIFQSWLIVSVIWVVAVWYTYFTCKEKYADCVMATIDSFESKYNITVDYVCSLYFGKTNKHVDDPNEEDDSIAKWGCDNRHKTLVNKIFYDLHETQVKNNFYL